MDVKTAILATVAALYGIALRKGQGVPIVKAVLLCVILSLVAGCSTTTYNYTPKSVKIMPTAFAFDRPTASAEEVTGQVPGDGEEMILPDGSYFSTSGGGSAGNLWLIITQNDGTAQESRASAEVETDADIDANVNSLDKEAKEVEEIVIPPTG